ncbi:MAG: hypothetical protein ACK4V2_00960 [Pseudomonadota bacterium]|jgi:hypothetical protein|nr:hypothetical protein [Alphaproteobacteria bacterium]
MKKYVLVALLFSQTLYPIRTDWRNFEEAQQIREEEYQRRRRLPISLIENLLRDFDSMDKHKTLELVLHLSKLTDQDLRILKDVLSKNSLDPRCIPHSLQIKWVRQLPEYVPFFLKTENGSKVPQNANVGEHVKYVAWSYASQAIIDAHDIILGDQIALMGLKRRYNPFSSWEWYERK